MSKFTDPHSGNRKFYVGPGQVHDRSLEMLDNPDLVHERMVKLYIDNWQKREDSKLENPQRQKDWKERKAEQNTATLKREHDEKIARAKMRRATKKTRRQRNRMEGRIAELDRQFSKDNPIK